jgi:hypothetical protein
VRKRPEGSERLFHTELGVFAATVIPLVLSLPALDMPPFDGEAAVA